jgi:hypothetical protein
MVEYYSPTELLAKSYWHDKRFDFAGGTSLIYIGVNRVPNASQSDPNWHIWKFSWTGTSLDRIQGPLDGTWAGRTTLGW